MQSSRQWIPALLLITSPLAAQTATSVAGTRAADHRDEVEAVAPPLLFGIAAGALSYQGDRQEQALGAVIHWTVKPWLSLSTTPTMVRIREPSVSTSAPLQTSSGLVDLPIDATLSHSFHAPWSPGVALGLGVSLPVGDTTSGFGAGAVGYSASAGLGFAPLEQLWVHLGAGRSLTDVTMRSAFTSGSGWGDASVGVSVTDRVGVSAGYSTDLGAADSSVGHSTSLNGGVSLNLYRTSALNLNASRGLSGLAPRWSLALGVGTAFPYLNHLGAGSPMDQLRDTFGGGTHGLDSGASNGRGGRSGKGKGRKPI